MANEKRLIDANALIAILEKIVDEDETPFFHLDEIVDEIMDAPTVNAIPIAVMKRAIDGISAADQADQAGAYSYRLWSALRTVLEWYGSPSYKEHERRTNG